LAVVAITAGTLQNFKARNIGVEMRVTPIIGADDRISWRLKPFAVKSAGFSA
jgi:type II secretory pathway component GspD/PulD (secretin)